MSQQGRKNADDVLLLSLASGATVESAGRSAGLSERTIYRRLKDPAFRQQLQQRRGDLVQRAAGLLTAASIEAIKTLLELQKSAVAEAVRLGAARSILDLGLKLREAADLHQQVAMLEERLQQVESARS